MDKLAGCALLVTRRQSSVGAEYLVQAAGESLWVAAEPTVVARKNDGRAPQLFGEHRGRSVGELLPRRLLRTEISLFIWIEVYAARASTIGTSSGNSTIGVSNTPVTFHNRRTRRALATASPTPYPAHTPGAPQPKGNPKA